MHEIYTKILHIAHDFKRVPRENILSIAQKVSAHQPPEAHQIRQAVERRDDNDLAIMISMVNSYQLSMKCCAPLNQSIFNVYNQYLD